MEFFYFLFIIPSQKAQVYNLIPALVLNTLLKESLLLFRKSNLQQKCRHSASTEIQFQCFFSSSFRVKRCGLLCWWFCFVFSLVPKSSVHGDVLPSHTSAECGHLFPRPSSPGNDCLHIQPKLGPTHVSLHLLFTMLTSKCTLLSESNA